jgi:hypothetical protein
MRFSHFGMAWMWLFLQAQAVRFSLAAACAMKKSLLLPMSMALRWSSLAPAISVTRTKRALIENHALDRN